MTGAPGRSTGATLWELQDLRRLVRSASTSPSSTADRRGRAARCSRTRAVNLSGGSVRADARGRGVYRALIRARWDDGVARGTPALTVQAGRMSRPVLERLGFETVSEQRCLIDRFGSG